MSATTATHAARAPLWSHALAAAGFVALSLFYLRPVIRLLGTHVATAAADPLLTLYMLKWGIHQLRLGMPDFWNVPFFFPARGMTATTDHLFGTAVLAALLTSYVPNVSNVVAAYNVLYIGSFALCGFNTWYVLRRCGVGAPAAFLGGCMFAFSSFRWDQADHLQILLMQWIPLLAWTFDRLLAQPGWKRAGFFLVLYLLHVTGGVYLAVMAHFPLLVLLLNQVPDLWRQRSKRRLTVLLTAGVLAGLMFLAVAVPRLLVRTGQRRLAHSNTEIQTYGASLVSFVTPADLNLYAGKWTARWRRRENALFAGFLPTVLVLAGAVAGWRRLRRAPLRPLSRRQRTILFGLAALAVTGYLLGEVITWLAFTGHRDWGAPDLYLTAFSLLAAGAAGLLLRRLWGGNWGLDLAALDPWERGVLLSGIACWFLAHMIVYLPLSTFLPGLAGMRVPARFYPFVSFSLSWFAARTLDGWLRRIAPAGLRVATTLAAGLFLLAELAPRPLPWSRIPGEAELPAVDHWLAGRDDVRAVLELPLRDDVSEASYLYAGTLHWKPLFNGYSGYNAPRYAGLRRFCCHPVPEGESLVRLRRWGVSHVVVHTGALPEEERPTVLAWGRQEGIQLEYAAGPDLVFRIQP